MIHNAILDQIKAVLESDVAYEMGLSIEGTVRREVNSICFNFLVGPGACRGEITVCADGTIYDSVSQSNFANYDEWLADFNEAYV